jgi:hypothetical protein
MLAGGCGEEDDGGGIGGGRRRVPASEDIVFSRSDSSEGEFFFLFSSFFFLFFGASDTRDVPCWQRRVHIYALDKDCVSKTDDDGLDLDHEDISLDTMVPASLDASARDQLYLQRSRSSFGDQRNNPSLRLMCWHIGTCRKRVGAVYVAQRILESTP